VEHGVEHITVRVGRLGYLNTWCMFLGKLLLVYIIIEMHNSSGTTFVIILRIDNKNDSCKWTNFAASKKVSTASLDVLTQSNLHKDRSKKIIHAFLLVYVDVVIYQLILKFTPSSPVKQRSISSVG
jgi:hypothetical protein